MYKKWDQVKLNQVSMNNNKNCQSPKFIKYVCSDKSCQENQDIIMQLVKPSIDMHLPKPAIPYKYTRLCSDKNCQSTRCYKKKSPVRPVCDDNNCQSANNMCFMTRRSESERTNFFMWSVPEKLIVNRLDTA